MERDLLAFLANYSLLVLAAVREFDHARQVFRRVGIEALLEAVINAVQLTTNRERRRAYVLGRLEPKFDGEVGGALGPAIDAIRNYHGGRTKGFHFFE